MGYTIPGWLDDVLDFIGINFPNVDEDDYREMATAMREFAEQFEGHGGDAHKAFSRILSSSEGWAVDSMEKHWNQIKGSHLEKLPELARLFADACDVLADIIFGMKTKAEIELGVMAASVGISAGLAVVTGGLSALIGAGEVAAMRQVVKRIIDEAVDRIVDEVLAKITEPINAKLEAMVEDMVLDLAEGAFSMPAADGSGGGHDGKGGMHIASAGDATQLASAGGGAQKRTKIDHIEFEDGAGKVSKHGGELHLAGTSSLGKARGAFGRSKGRDPFTQAFDSVLHGALKGSEKALGKVAKHITETVPERVKGASRLHKGKDHDVRDKVNAIVGGKKDGDGRSGDGTSGSGAPLKIDEARKNDPDLVERAKDARAFKDKEFCGDPIDMASGQMAMAQTDVDLPGILPLTLRRTHLTGYAHGISFGPSWASTLDERLEKDPAGEGVWWRREDGSSLYYPRTPDIVGDRVDPAAGERLPLTYLSQGSSYMLVVDDPRAGLTRHFEPAEAREGTWWLTRIEDRNHHHITLERDEDDALSELAHSAGYRLPLTTAPDTHRVTAVHALTEDGPLRLRGYSYDDESGDLNEVRNAVDAPTRFTYDAAHRVTGWRDSNDTEFTYTYDASGRVVATQGSDGFLNSRISYAGPHDDASTTARYTDSLGHSTTYRANPHGQVIAITDPLGNTTTQTWDSRDHLLTRTDPLGHTVTRRYDAEGRLVTIVRPDGAETTAEYGELSRLTGITTPDGNTTRHTYDSRGNRTSLTGPSGLTTRFTYDDAGRPTTLTDPLGSVTAIRCDRAGVPVEITDPLGALTRYERDALGRPVTITDPTGTTTCLEWTAEGQLTRRTAPDSTVESWTYDGEGNCTTHVDQLGGVTHFEYTHFDLLAARTNPDGVRYTFTHDTELHLTEVVNPQGLTWSYTRDAAGRLIAETDFDDRSLTYRHDAAGRLAARVNPLGQTTGFERDALGQALRRNADGQVTTYAYDVAGRLVQAQGPDGTDLTIVRDLHGQVRSEIVDGRELVYSRDALGRRDGRRTPTGATTTWDHDAAGRRTHLVASGRPIDISYDAAGRELTRHIDEFLTLHHTYDPLGRLTSQSATSGDGRTLQHRAYTYRPDGHLSAVDDQLTGRREFDLDAAGRVTTVHAKDWTETYAYDTAGNQTHADWPDTHPGHEATGERTYSGTDLTRAGSVRYEHDALGRVTLRQKTRLSRKPDTWRYTWDAEDRLAQAITPDGTVWRYTYDPLGRRTAKLRYAADGETVVERTEFTWDGATLCEQTTYSADLPNPIALTWDHQGPLPIAQTERHLATADAPQTEIDSRFFAIVTDLVGTPRELIGEDGSVAWRTRSTLWGATAWNATSATTYTPLRFPGQYYDPETGLHHNYFRHYDPETARYLTADPLRLAPSPNPVGYVTNPTASSDPLGLAPDDCPIRLYRSPKMGFRESAKYGLNPAEHPANRSPDGKLHEGTAYLGEDEVVAARYAGEGGFEPGFWEYRMKPEFEEAFPADQYRQPHKNTRGRDEYEWVIPVDEIPRFNELIDGEPVWWDSIDGYSNRSQ
ncbi:DUF6531 domain-containing protein [Streptomyces sp. NPDC050264]|uniref:DUF6531 domain-containing protein n=1 Tax=Streptomyces sp. NPDC050264 TaxID=3155038 RepID=UPI00342C55DF